MQLYLIVRIVLYVHIIVKQHKTKNDECTNTNKHIHAYTHTGRQRITQKLMLIKNVCGGTGTTTTTTSALTNSNSCCHCCFSWSSCCCCYLFCCCCILINSCCCQNRTSAHTHTANKQTKHMYIHMYMYTRGHAHTHTYIISCIIFCCCCLTHIPNFRRFHSRSTCHSRLHVQALDKLHTN